MRRLLHFSRWFLACCVGMAMCGAAIAAPGAFSFDPSPVINIAAGQQAGKAVFVLRLSGDPASPESTLQLEERGAIDRPKIDVHFEPGDPNREPGALVWFVTASVTAIPVNTTSVRYLTARYGNHVQVLPYTLSNKPAADFSWDVKPPPEKRSWSAGEVLRFTVSVGPVPATDVRLLNGSFLNSETFGGLNDRFNLCLDGAASCPAGPIVLDANRSHDLVIRMEGNDPVAPGQYSGLFTVVAAEEPKGSSFPMTLYVSNTCVMAFGVVLIVVGIIASFIVGTWTQWRTAQNTILRPATRLREEADRLSADFFELAETGFPKVQKALETVMRDLSRETLRTKGYLGSTIPSLGGAAMSAEAAQKYESHLDSLSTKLSALAVLLHAGHRTVKMCAGASDEATRSSLTTAQAALDDLAAEGFVPDKDAFSAAAEQILVKLRGSSDMPQDHTADPAWTVGYSSQRISFETEALNLAGWLVFGLLSLAVGSYLLILANPGFGQWKDLLYCLLWGFGMPAASEKLSTLSNAGIAQGFGVTMTRVVS